MGSLCVCVQFGALLDRASLAGLIVHTAARHNEEEADIITGAQRDTTSNCELICLPLLSHLPLSSPRRPGQKISTNSAVGPLCVQRRASAALRKYGCGASVTTRQKL